MANSFVAKDHYAILGAKRDDNLDEIKRRYRKRAKEIHPDLLGPDASEEDLQAAHDAVAELTTAYEHLSDPELRKMVDLAWPDNSSAPPWGFFFDEESKESVETPPPGQFFIGGVYCWVEFDRDHWGRHLSATVTIQLVDIFRMQRLHDLPHNAWVTKYIVVDPKGDSVGSGYSLLGLQYDLKRLQAQERRNVLRRQWRVQLDALNGEIKQLRKQGSVVGRAETLLWKARNLAASGIDSLRGAPQADTVVRAIRELEKEIARVAEADASEVLLDDLLNGSLQHPDVPHNRKLVQRLRVLEFRTGGDYTAPTPAQVKEHYRSKLTGLRTYEQVQAAGLKLDDDTPVVMEMVASGDIVLAPDTVEVQGNKRPVAHTVQYGFARIDGKDVPAGVITVTESAYERCSAQYGRISSFPTLPHGILLLIQVKVKVLGQEVLSAPRPDGKPLQNEVQRRRAALRAPRTEEDDLDFRVLSFSDLMYGNM